MLKHPQSVSFSLPSPSPPQETVRLSHLSTCLIPPPTCSWPSSTRSAARWCSLSPWQPSHRLPSSRSPTPSSNYQWLKSTQQLWLRSGLLLILLVSLQLCENSQQSKLTRCFYFSEFPLVE